MKHGQRITIKNKLVRKEKDFHTNTDKFWAIEEMKPTKAIFLGIRTLSNGERHWDDECIYYIPKEYIKVALVSVNANTNPFYSLI